MFWVNCPFVKKKSRMTHFCFVMLDILHRDCASAKNKIEWGKWFTVFEPQHMKVFILCPKN